MIRPWPPQDPQAKLNYWFSAANAIEEQNSPLASYTITVTDGDGALTVSGESEANGVVSFWLASPAEGVTYTVTFHFELANGYADDESRTLTGEQR